MKKISLFILLLAAVACTKVDDSPSVLPDPSGDVALRAIVVAEGQFGYGTGSLTNLYDDGTVVTDVFRSVNSRPLGDIPQSITRIGDYFYVPVNNSQKVEVFDCQTFTSVETMIIDHVSIPMFAVDLGGNLIAVSDQCSSEITTAGVPSTSALTIMNINHQDADRQVVVDTVSMPIPSFQMAVVGEKLFVACSEFSVFDIENLEGAARRTIDGGSVNVTDFSKICIDSRGYLWVRTAAELVCVDPDSEQVLERVAIPAMEDDVYGSLDIDPSGRILYFSVDTQNGDGDWIVEVYSVDTQSASTPSLPLFEHNQSDTWTTYALQVSPQNTIFLIRVKYGSITRGRVFEYDLDGDFVAYYDDDDGVSQPYFSAGIFPHYIYFSDAN